MVFQSAMNSLNPVMTIGDQIVDIFTTHAGYSRKESLRRAAELLELVRIDPARLKSYPHQLSGGMRQRAVIAMAVALKPSLLILDEPTTALDVVVQQEIMAQIKDLQHELGFSVLFITHDMSLMVELSHRMAVMYGGRIVETAKSRDIHTAPRHPYTQALMGAFPPLTGPRVPLTGLADGVKFSNIADLQEVAPGAFRVPVSRAQSPNQPPWKEPHHEQAQRTQHWSPRPRSAGPGQGFPQRRPVFPRRRAGPRRRGPGIGRARSWPSWGSRAPGRAPLPAALRGWRGPPPARSCWTAPTS